MIALRTQPLLLDPQSYDHIIVSFSGGKDSQACVLEMLDMGVNPKTIELWHQHIDGDRPGSFMDWPCTPDYCRKWAQEIGMMYPGVTHCSQWKDGGFEREMLRNQERTRGIYMEAHDGTMRYLPPSSRGKVATRRKFPQVSADLSVRWCSAYLKIDVAARALNNDERLREGKILYISGERREESAARSKYAEAELHRCHRQRRLVHHWRIVINHDEKRVWDVIRNAGMVPHPAYRLGWGRLSCLSCIFGDPDQWASVQYLARSQFNKIANYETEFGHTIIHKKVGGKTVQLPVIQRAREGQIYDATLHAPESLRQQALATEYTDTIRVNSRAWELPAGAFKRCGGPT